MNASEIMTSNVLTVVPGMGIKELAAIFIEKGISGAPVVDASGKYLGVVLEESLIVQDKKVHLPTFINVMFGYLTIGEKRFEDELKKIAAITVEGIMDKNHATLKLNSELEEIATLMIEKGVNYFPVIDSGKVAGVITRRDIVRTMVK
ncbi:MAG: CBS domain-containing protein [Endomicrobiales bacterium]|nr:CBS domain-containing protein [Endomicrobiales bacterium]